MYFKNSFKYISFGLLILILSSSFNFTIAHADADINGGNKSGCSLTMSCGWINSTVAYSPSGAVVRAGDYIDITVTFDIPVLDSPVPQFIVSGPYVYLGGARDMTKIDSTHYFFTEQVPAETPNGTESITLANVQDAFGNTLAEIPLSGASFTIDNALAKFDGGTGTDTDPYQISTCDQLQAMRDNLTASYALVSDVNCTATATWNGGLGFNTIGRGSSDFGGNFFGRGYTIDHLTINRPNQGTYTGLFGFNQGLITNVHLTNVSIAGGATTGAVAGRSKGDIRLVSVTGSVTGTSEVGGVVGESENPITYADVNGTIVGTGDSVGGVVGNFSSTGRFLSSHGVVVSSGSYVGGIAGQMRIDGGIFDSYSTATVAEIGSGSDVGGIVGFLNGSENNVSVQRVYATGEVTLSNEDLADGDNFGGVVGLAFDTFTISDGFAYNHVANTAHTGAVAGYFDYNSHTNGSMSQMVWATSEGGPSHCVNGGMDTLMEGCVSIGDFADFQTNSTSSPFKNGDLQIWDFTNIWNVQTDAFPQLRDMSMISYNPEGIFLSEVQVGQHLLLTVDFTAPLADSPVPQIALSGADTLESTNMTKVSASQYIYDYVGGSGDGDVVITLSQGETGIPVANFSYFLIPGNEFILNNVAPVITEVTPFSSPTDNQTPSYTYSSTKPGTFTDLDCGTSEGYALPGNNTFTFATLSDGTHTCHIKVTDDVTGDSNILAIGPFVIGSPAPSSGGGGPVPVFPVPAPVSAPVSSVVAPVVPPAPLELVPFTDIIGHWANDFVSQLYRMKIGDVRVVSGRTSVLFVPDQNITWAEAVKIGLLAYGYKVDTSASPTDAWYTPYLYLAKKEGFLPSKTLMPNKNISRIDALVLFLKMAKKSGDAKSAPFKDITRKNSYALFVNFAFENGVIGGFENNTKFRPNANITRAEIAKIILKIKGL